MTAASIRAAAIRYARTPETWVLLAAIVHLAISWWWIGTDTHTPDAESARQLGFSFHYTTAMQDGDLFAPFRGTFSSVMDLYPPVHGLLASTWSLIFGKSISGVLTAQTLVYLPLMVVGAYGAGRVLYGRVGGALAAIFLMAVPVFGPLFHIFLVDTATLAFAAPSIWLLLASRRFESVGIALAAGVVVGLGMLTKTNFAFVWPGLVAVMVLRGGWRNWRGLLVFAGALLVVAAPWYIGHIPELRQQYSFYSADNVSTYTPALQDLHKFGLRHLSYYPRALLQVNVYVPLLVFFAIGSVFSVVRFVLRRGGKHDYTPELLVGLLVFWFGLLNVDQADWRFALAGLVYIALLSVGWVVALPRPWRLAVSGLLGVIFLVNTVMTNVNVGKNVAWSPGGYNLTFVSPKGIAVNEPNGVSKLPYLLKAAHRDGIKNYWVFGPNESPPFIELSGVGAMADAADIHFVPGPKLGRDDIGVIFRGVRKGDPPPCSWVTERGIDKTGIYFFRGPANTKKLGDLVFGGDPRSLNLYCP